MSKHEPRGIRVVKRKVAKLANRAILYHKLKQEISDALVSGLGNDDYIKILQQQQFDKAAALCQHIISKRKTPNE